MYSQYKADLADFLDADVEQYSGKDFNPEVSAQNFYAKNSNEELSKRLNDLTVLKGTIETKLKQKVRENYGIFLNTNEEIQKVGKDMTDLQGLIANTGKLIDDVRKNRISEAKIMRNNNSIPQLLDKYKEMEYELQHAKDSSNVVDMSSIGSLNLTNADMAKIPPWVISACDEISIFIIEKQYVECVRLILKLKSFLEEFSSKKAISAESPLYDIQQKVEEQSLVLSKVIKKSLSAIPTSHLWGHDEQLRRLRLLINLGEFYGAAEGFADNQVDIMKFIYKYTENNGDILHYISSLCKAFVSQISDISNNFMELFDELKEDPKIMCYLLDYINSQIKLLIALLSKHVQLGMKEYASIVILKMRAAAANSCSNRPAPSASKEVAIDDIVDNSSDDSDGDNNAHGRHSKGGRNSTASRVLEELPYPDISIGTLKLSSQCLNIILTEIRHIDEQGLQGMSLVLYLILPNLVKYTLSFGDDIVKELSSQVRQDPWNGVKPFSATVMAPKNIIPVDEPAAASSMKMPSYFVAPGAVVQEMHSIGVGNSYNWLVAVLSHLMDDSGMLLRLSNDKKMIHNSQNIRNHRKSISMINNNDEEEYVQYTYSRADVNDLEVATVTVVILILLRYVSEIESIDRQTLSAQQLKCYLLSVKGLHSCVIPSVKRILSDNTFVDNLLTAQYSSSEILDSLTQRLQTISK